MAKKVAVFGHERSGNHFLMNTIALNFGYISKPWWNLDFELGIDFHNPKALLAYLKKAHNQPIKNILKSHHHYGFIEPIIEYVIEQFYVFYIYRDPRDVLISNQKLIEKIESDEGPKGLSISEFIRSAPRGRMMRYQKHQSENMLTRWKEHVEPWLEIANNNKGVFALSYENLVDDFEATVVRLSKFIDITPKRIIRPDKQTNVINPGSGRSGGWKTILNKEDCEFFKPYISYSNAREKLE